MVWHTYSYSIMLHPWGTMYQASTSLDVDLVYAQTKSIPILLPNHAALMVSLSGSGGAQIAGEDYTLTCQITGGGTMTPTYRWFRSNSVITGQTSDTLSFSPLKETDSGVYTCEGTRSFITVTSGSLTLTVMGT